MNRRTASVRAACALVLALTGGLLVAPAAQAEQTYIPISGAGSTWSQVALDQWRMDTVKYGIKVDFAGTGSTDGRTQFRNGTVDYAMTDAPYGLTADGIVDEVPTRAFSYVPLVAGGLAFAYNLTDAKGQVTALRLSGADVAGIFTGTITWWDAPSLVAHNPGITLPHVAVRPVMRADGAGDSYVLSRWIEERYPATWSAYCVKAGKPADCGPTSNYPVPPTGNFVQQSGSLGVAGYTRQSQNVGTITYVANAYAIESHLPTAKVLNNGGYYAPPSANNISIALLKGDSDPRAYPLPMYSSMIVPTAVESRFSLDKGYTLARFLGYALCHGQQKTPHLGYAPLPANLVQSGLATAATIPGADTSGLALEACDNQTLDQGDDVLDLSVPAPPACDAPGPIQCGVPTTSVVTARMSLTASAGVVSNGKKVTLRSGVAGLSPNSGRALILERRTSARSPWTGVSALLSDGSGKAVFTIKPSRTYDYRVRISSTPRFVGAASAVRTVKVRFAVSAKGSKASVKKGKKATVKGTVGPVTAKRKVQLEVYRKGKWVRVRTATTTAHGNYTLKVPTSKRGKKSYRVRTAADASHLAGWSRTVKIKVT